MTRINGVVAELVYVDKALVPYQRDFAGLYHLVVSVVSSTVPFSRIECKKLCIDSLGLGPRNMVRVIM